MNHNLILKLSTFILAFVVVGFLASPLQAQEKAPISKPSTQTNLEERLDQFESDLNKVSAESQLTGRIELFINLLTLFATVFAIVAGLIAWNIYTITGQARKELEEIKKMHSESSELSLALKQWGEELIKGADDILKQAGEKDQKLGKMVSDWEQKRAAYFDASGAVSRPKPRPISPSTEAVLTAMKIRAGIITPKKEDKK